MKRRLFLSTILPAAILLKGCGNRPFHFIQMADTQIGMIEGGKDGNLFVKETVMLEKVISRINRMKPAPAFVVVCGDMTNLAGHERQITEYKRLMGLLNPSIPYYNVPGNHDFSGNPNPENLAFYRKTYGLDWYSFTIKGQAFVVLNSTLIKFPDSAPEEAENQKKWVNHTLALSSGTTGTIIFMHHPFFDNDIDEDDGYHSMNRADRKTWLDMFAEYNVKAVFSGHRHTTIPEHSYMGVLLINTNAVCYSFDQHPGLRDVIVSGNEIQHVFYPYDALPENIEVLV